MIRTIIACVVLIAVKPILAMDDSKSTLLRRGRQVVSTTCADDSKQSARFSANLFVELWSRALRIAYTEQIEPEPVFDNLLKDYQAKLAAEKN